MNTIVSRAFGTEVQNLRSLIVLHYKHADDDAASTLEFAAKMVERAQAALDAGDGGGTWLQITGALDLMRTCGIADAEVARIRKQVDSLLEAA